ESGGSRALARPVLPKHPRLTPHSVRARELRSRPPSKRSSTRPCASLSSVRKARGELRTESEGTLLPRPLGLLKAAPAERSRGPPQRVRRWLTAGATTRRLLAGAPLALCTSARSIAGRNRGTAGTHNRGGPPHRGTARTPRCAPPIPACVRR